MRRISTSTKVTDKFGAGKHGFTNGDPLGAVKATDLEADLFDHIQEELCSVIEAAGLVVDGTSLNQLLTALRSAGLFTTPAQFDSTTKAATTAFVRNELLGLGNAAYSAIYGASKAASGYQKLPSGLIIQWGRSTIATNGSTITLPIAFPTAHLRSFANYGEAGAAGVVESRVQVCWCGLRTLTNFVGKAQTTDGTNSGTSVFDWFAIGY